MAASRTTSSVIKRHGIEFTESYAGQYNDLNIELGCYRDQIGFPSGQPKELHFKNAFRLMWPEFQWNDWMELMCWAWCNYRLIVVMGHTRASKSYGCSFFTLLDYLAAPQSTATTLTTTKFDALKTRMWGDMMRAIETARQRETIAAVFKVTSTQNEMTMKLRGTPADDKFMIQGVATDSADKSAGKIRGQHADRRRIIVDEAQDVAPAIFMAFLNAMSAPDFKGALLTNPVEKISEFGDWAKPKGGYTAIHDTDLFWETDKPDGICLHLDGLQSPNIKAGKTIFPFLLTQEYVDSIRQSKGEDSLEWWMYVRGFFPPDGLVARIWSSGTIEKASRSEVFDYKTTGWASLDPAFEGDECVFIWGDMGTLRNGRSCACARGSLSIKVKVSPGSEEKDFQIARECIRLCKERDIEPENFIMDMTGNGRGVFAIMRNEWKPLPGRGQVQGIYYGGEATDRPLRMDDPLPASDQVKYFVAELWFRASYMARDGMLCGLASLDAKTVDDLNSRRYTIKQTGDKKLMVAETKAELKKRIGRSPDYGDALVGVAELMVRKGLIGAIAGTGQARSWDQIRARAKKAQKRYEGEFAHHG